MSKFKVGDKVRLVKTAYTGINEEDLARIIVNVQEVGKVEESTIILVDWPWHFEESWLELAEQNDFQTVQEVWRYLADGGTIVYRDNGIKYKFIDGILYGQQREAKELIKVNYLTVITPSHWGKYQEPQWFENIPETGVLCWVWDREKYKDLGIVIGYDVVKDPVFPYETRTSVYKSATPASLEEIEKYILNDEHILLR